MPKLRKWQLRLLVSSVAALAMLLLMDSPFFRDCIFVDVHTGRQRSIRYVAFVRTRDVVVETAISRLWRQYFGAYPEPDWQLNQKLWGFLVRHSDGEPEFAVNSWELELGWALDYGTFDEATKREIIRSYIGYLERRQPGFAHEYVSDVLSFATKDRGVAATNVPTWLPHPESPYKPKYAVDGGSPIWQNNSARRLVAYTNQLNQHTTYGYDDLTPLAGPTRKFTPAEQVWIRSENECRTNDVAKSYQLVSDARNQLTEMWNANQGGLDYPYCLAILNGRLFIMARSLGRTNDAEEFFNESARCWNLVREDLRLPRTNYSAVDIEAKIRNWDARDNPGTTNTLR
jgi:hypothetical protein